MWKKVENKIKKRANKLLLKNSTQSYKKKVVDLKDITDYQNKAQEHKRLTFRLSNPTKWIKKKKKLETHQNKKFKYANRFLKVLVKYVLYSEWIKLENE